MVLILGMGPNFEAGAPLVPILKDIGGGGGTFTMENLVSNTDSIEVEETKKSNRSRWIV